MILWGLVKIIFGGLLTFIGVLLVGLWDKAYKWVTSLGNDIKSVGKIAGLVLAVIVMIIAAIWGAPIMLIIGLGILAYKVGKWLVSQIPGFASGELRRIADKIGQMVSSKINRSTSSSTMR